MPDSVSTSSTSTQSYSPNRDPQAIPYLGLKRIAGMMGSVLGLIILANWLISNRLLTLAPNQVSSQATSQVTRSPALIAPTPAPPTITLQIDGKTPQAKYLVPLTRQPQTLTVTWAVSGKAAQVEILPAPGKVAAQGSLIYQLGTQAATDTLTIKATNAMGQTVSQSVGVEIFDPTGASGRSRNRAGMTAPVLSLLPTAVSRSPKSPLSRSQVKPVPPKPAVTVTQTLTTITKTSPAHQSLALELQKMMAQRK